MNRWKLLLILLVFSAGWRWGDLSLNQEESSFQVRTEWVADTREGSFPRVQSARHSAPLVDGEVVFQPGEAGLKAYKKSNGDLIWKYESGFAGPLVLEGKSLYFGSEDGFFYSLDRDTGSLNWKFRTGSSNASHPLVHEGKIYWLTAGQKLYALSLKGERLWSFPGPDPYAEFVLAGSSRVVVRRKLLYVGFYQGVLAALDKDSGKIEWIQKLGSAVPERILPLKRASVRKKSSSKLNSSKSKRGRLYFADLPSEYSSFPLKPDRVAFRGFTNGLFFKAGCLMAPVFDFYLFCLNPTNGKIKWKRKGVLTFSASGGAFYQYQSGRLSRLSENGKTLWSHKTKEEDPAFPPLSFDSFLAYGFPSYGKLIFALSKTGEIVKEHKFGRGISSPVVLDPEDKGKLYFLSIDGYLHKISFNSRL